LRRERSPPAKVPRIAFLAGGSRAADAVLIETFWQRLKERGYVEGKNITAELVASLAHPGANVTGLSAFVSELGAKQLEILKEAFPKVSRVAVLWWDRPNPRGIGQDELLLGKMKVTAGALRVTLHPLALRGVDDFESAFSTIKGERANAVIALRNPLTTTHREQIVAFATQNRLPAMYGDKQFVDAGGLMSYGVNVVTCGVVRPCTSTRS
jgi:putative ABC transport system substrate-binding protein